MLLNECVMYLYALNGQTITTLLSGGMGGHFLLLCAYIQGLFDARAAGGSSEIQDQRRRVRSWKTYENINSNRGIRWMAYSQG